MHGIRLAETGNGPRVPDTWWQVLTEVLDRLLSSVDRERVFGMAVDGTSGSVLAIDEAGRPLGDALMYGQAVENASILARIGMHMPRPVARRIPVAVCSHSISMRRHSVTRPVTRPVTRSVTRSVNSEVIAQL